MPTLLSPLGFLYGRAVRYRWDRARPYISRLPVICIGNFTMGGAGKTPMAIHTAEMLYAAGHRPVFLTRGYGGKIRGPHLVDISSDRSRDTGDEPLLLARTAPAVVCANRPVGARFIESREDLAPSVIIMDDGFQNPGIHKTINIVVVDSERGTGNGRIFPAGPLREDLNSQMARVDFLIEIGQQRRFSTLVERSAYFSGKLQPQSERNDWEGRQVLAYSGIARPEKFYITLRELGAQVRITQDFPDHYQFKKSDAERLLSVAEQNDLQLVTTEKDLVRLDTDIEPFAELREKSRVIPVKLALCDEDRDRFVNLVTERLSPYID